jgi:hypothetical protein
MDFPGARGLPQNAKSKKKNSRLSLPQHRVRTKALPVVLDLDQYDFEKVIGEGKFSSVVAGRHKETGQVRCSQFFLFSLSGVGRCVCVCVWQALCIGPLLVFDILSGS